MRTSLPLLFTLAVALSMPPYPVNAQTPELRLTLDDGLPSRYLIRLAQDDEGFLWIGTTEGLARYDGRHLHVYPQRPGPGGFPNRWASALHVGPTGTLWVGSTSPQHHPVLYRFERRTETFTAFPLSPDGEGLAAERNEVTAILEARDGTVWVGSHGSGIYRLDPTTGEVTHPVGITPAGYAQTVHALHEDGRGHVWAAVGDYVRRLHPAAAEAWYTGSDWSAVYGFFEYEGALFAVRSSPARAPTTMMRYDEFTGQFVSLGSDWPISSVVLAQDGADAWLSVRQGLFRFSLPTPPRHLPPPIWDGTLATALLSSRDGDLWLGTEGGGATDGGVYRLAPRGAPFRTLTTEGGLEDPSVNAILAAPDSTLWVATNDGLYRRHPQTGRLDRFVLSPPGPAYTQKIWSLAFDHDGTLLVGSSKRGLFRFRRGQFEPVPLPSFNNRAGLTNEHTHIRHLYAEPDGTLWVGASTGLLRRSPQGTWEDYIPNPDDETSLPHLYVNVIRRDSRGRVWVGTDFGLVEWDEAAGQVRRHFAPSDGLRHPIIWTIHEARDGSLWVGTVGGGLHRFYADTGRFEAITTADGLPSNVVYGILPEPGTDALWLSTADGLARFDPATGAVEPYTAADGLAGDAFNLMAYHAAGDQLFFGGERGVTYFRPHEVRRPSPSGSVAFTGLSVYDESRLGLLASGDTVRLAPDESFFTVAFTAVDFTPSERHFRYRLDGYEDRWHRTDDDAPEASYTGVAPGAYRLVVQRLDRTGQQPIAEASLAVFVAPAWWQRGAVQVLGLLLVLTLAGVTGGLVQRRRQRTAEAEAAHEAEQAREATLRLAASREAERQRLARELHDGPLQDLYGLGHRLDDLAERNGGAAEVLAVREAVTHVADELRGVCTALRPPVLAHFGPAAALRAHVERLARRPGAPRLRFEATGDGKNLTQPAQLTLFRIGQEALNNAVKHAEASEVRARLEPAEGGLRLTVEDDGVGFRRPATLTAFARRDHFGLVGARERADAVGGRFHFESTKGEGTRVEVWLPLAPDAN